MNNELTFAASMANPVVRRTLAPYCKDLEWESPVAKNLVEALSQVQGTLPSPALIRTTLAPVCVEQEIKEIAGIMKDFYEADKKDVDAIINSFDEFYQTRRLSDVMERWKHDPVKMKQEIAEIPTIQTSAIPLARVGELEVHEVMEQELGGASVLPTNFDFIRRATPWNGYLKGQVCMVCAPPGVGKSLWIANEVVLHLKEGAKVYWVALGDMFMMDFITRLTAIIKEVDYYQVCISPEKYFDDEVRAILKNLRVTVLPAGSHSIDMLASFIDNNVVPEEDIDVFVLDYDANLKDESDSSYKTGEVIYNKLTEIARPLDRPYRLVFAASQPKISYWEEEELPKECASDSSRKQAVIDLMVTIGVAQGSTTKCGIMKAAKVRRGKEGEKSPYHVLPFGKFQEIEREKYGVMRKAQ